MPDPISTLALATGGAFLGKFVGPAAEALGKVALERAQQLGAKATALLGNVGREPQAVAPKLLVPLVQAAALEDEPSMADLWAALLANAADPAQHALVQPGFVEVLRQLTPTDARVLLKIYDKVDVDFFASTYDLKLVRTLGFEESLFITRKELVTSIDNLLRLRLCSQNSGSTLKMSDTVEDILVSDAVYPTAFGYTFLIAVTLPIS